MEDAQHCGWVKEGGGERLGCATGKGWKHSTDEFEYDDWGYQFKHSDDIHGKESDDEIICLEKLYDKIDFSFFIIY